MPLKTVQKQFFIYDLVPADKLVCQGNKPGWKVDKKTTIKWTLADLVPKSPGRLVGM